MDEPARRWIDTRGDGFGSRVIAAADAFWVSMSEHNTGFSNPEACYRDLLSCQGGSRPVLLRSADGLEWVEIDLDALLDCRGSSRSSTWQTRG